MLCAEAFAYDAVGNFTDAEDSDTSGRLAVLGGSVSVAKNGYDNMVSISIELNHKQQNLPLPKIENSKKSAGDKEAKYGLDDFEKGLLGGLGIAGSSARIAYIIANDATILGVIDDWLLIPLGLGMLSA